MGNLSSPVQCQDALRGHLAHDPASGPLPRDVAVHLARCPSCAGAIDDLAHEEIGADQALEQVARRRGRPSHWLRVCLAAAGAVQVVLAVTWLFDVNVLSSLSVDASAQHLARDGAIGLFVGVAAVVAAFRPRTLVGMTVILGMATVLQVVAGAADTHGAQVSGLFELSHLLVPLILVLMLVALVQVRAAAIGEPTRQPGLRVRR